jgi:hypothetical protein
MAAPVAGYVQLPSDTANTGKKNRTATKVVGSDTVHEHYVVPSPGFTRTGRHAFQSSMCVVSTAGTNTTHFVLAMTTAATHRAVLRSIDLSYSITGTIAATTASPLIVIQKATYGTVFTASTNGAVINFQSSSTTSQLNAYLGSSGASVGTPVPFASFAFPALLTTIGTYGGQTNLWRSGGDQNSAETGLEMKAGDLLQVLQPTTGSNGEQRTFTLRFEWDQIDVS